jgi:hypothetical protein
VTLALKRRNRDNPEPGYLLSSVLIAVLVIPQIAALAGLVDPGDRRLGSIFTGTYLIVMGLMFLASYYWSHKSFVFAVSFGFASICLDRLDDGWHFSISRSRSF